MPTSIRVYPGRDTFASEILLAERKERRSATREWLDAIQEQVNASLLRSPGLRPPGRLDPDRYAVDRILPDSTKFP